MISPIKISPLFKVNAASGPVSVLQAWYDSLSVKPSEGLWTDLKIMADGMNTDGDWTEMDFFSMIAAMETDEQRLRPLKTTSGDDMIPVNSPTLNINGAQGNGTSSYINSKWSPITDAVKFTQNNASISMYVHQVGTTSNRYYAGNYTVFLFQASVNGTSNRIAISNSAPGLVAGTVALGYRSGYRVNSATVNLYHSSGTVSSVAQTTIENYPDDIAILATLSNAGVPGFYSNSIQRILIAGSGIINNTNVRTRLNTFFASRGLATY